jgi:hypothetical protein
MPRDAWVALAVAAASAASLWELARTPGTGAFVKTTTFPSAVCTLLLALALLHFAGAWLRRARPPAAAGARGGAARAAGLFGLTALYIVALPWTGYFLSSALYFGAASLLFGNRQPVSIVVAMIVVPLALLLFFEKYMVVLLPAARLFE